MLGVYDALVFDFDGLILDTESSAFHAWTAVYRHHGVEPFGIDIGNQHRIGPGKDAGYPGAHVPAADDKGDGPLLAK